MALFCAAIRRDSVSLVRFTFHSNVQIFSCEMFLSRLKRPLSYFSSHFCFSSFYHSVGHCIVSIVFDGRNQSSSVFLYVDLESLYRCVNTVFNAGKSSSSPLS